MIFEVECDRRNKLTDTRIVSFIITDFLNTTSINYCCRYSHSSWKTKDGVLLLGGSNYISGYTSEIVKEDNMVSELSFSLKFDIE